jgi:hypothetical protein
MTADHYQIMQGRVNVTQSRVVIQFAQDLSLRFRDDRLFSVSFRAHREKSFFALQRDPFKLHHHPVQVVTQFDARSFTCAAKNLSCGDLAEKAAPTY